MKDIIAVAISIVEDDLRKALEENEKLKAKIAKLYKIWLVRDLTSEDFK